MFIKNQKLIKNAQERLQATILKQSKQLKVVAETVWVILMRKKRGYRWRSEKRLGIFLKAAKIIIDDLIDHRPLIIKFDTWDEMFTMLNYERTKTGRVQRKENNG